MISGEASRAAGVFGSVMMEQAIRRYLLLLVAISTGVQADAPALMTNGPEQAYPAAGFYSSAAASDGFIGLNEYLRIDNSLLDFRAGSYWSLGDAMQLSLYIGWRSVDAAVPGMQNSSAAGLVAGTELRSLLTPQVELFGSVRRTMLAFEEEKQLHGEWLRIGARYLVASDLSLGLEVGRLRRHFESADSLRVDAVIFELQYDYR